MKTICFKILYYLGILDLLRFLNRHNVVILLYHGVSKNIINNQVRNSKYLHIDLDNFKQHIQYLKKKYHIIPLQDICDIIQSGEKIPAYTAVITFDDGYRNVFDNAFPVLRDYAVAVSMFLTDKLILKDNWLWLDKVRYMIDVTSVESVDIFEQIHSLKNGHLKIRFLDFIGNKLKEVRAEARNKIMEELRFKLKVDIPEHPCEEYRLMSFEQARQMQYSKLISFGSHTPEHTILTLEDPEQASRLILESKREVSEQLQREVDLFSYPNGSYNNRIKEMLKGSGFRCGLTTNTGLNNLNTDLFELKRVSVGAGDSLIPFIAHLSGIREYSSLFLQFLRKIVK